MNRFDKIKHKYYIGERQLLSVTKFISRYTRPFNASMVAHMSSKRDGLPPEHYLDLWDLKRTISTNYGNSIHEAIELWIKYKEKPTQAHLLKAVEKFEEQFGHIEWQSEVKIFNEEYELGGTVDLLSENIIADIKTNDTLKSEKKGNFIKPLNKVKVNNLNKVRLQTKIYQELLGKDMQRLVYMWNGEDFEVIELEDIDVSELLNERLLEISI